MKTKENNIVRISRGNQPDPVDVIRQLNETLNAVDMQEATNKLKSSNDYEESEFRDYYYGMDYIIHTILKLGLEIRQYFLDTAKIVVGIADNKECCWISFCGWYIFADGMYLIKMTNIKYSDFEPIQVVDAKDFAHRYYIEDDSAIKKDSRQKMS